MARKPEIARFTGAAPRLSGRRWIVLAILFLVYVCNVADRLVLSILAQDIKLDLHLSDGQIGLLIGPAIAFFYAVLGIPMAYVADRVNRVRFLAICMMAWSLLTAVGGATSSVMQLALSRIGVSAVEAGGSPTASSIIADYFPPLERPTAMGIYAAASTIGVLISFGVGGLIDASIGWRWTLVAAGLPGAILAVLVVAIVREPTRGALDTVNAEEVEPAHKPRSLFAGLGALWRIRFYRQVVIAAGLSNFCFHAVLNWGPSLIMRKFYAGTGHAGLSLGSGIALCGGIAAIVGGRVTSSLAASGVGRPLRIAAGLQFLSGPLMLAALFSPRLDLCLIPMCIAYGFQSFFVPIYWSVSQSHVPKDQRAMAAAIILLAIAVVGPGLSAPLIGTISDALMPAMHGASLQYALAIGTTMNLVTAWLFWRSARTADRDHISA